MHVAPPHASPNAVCTPADVFFEIEEVARRFRRDSLKESIETTRRMLARLGTVAVAVLGSFKAGKSSFINTLAGSPLLPAMPGSRSRGEIGMRSTVDRDDSVAANDSLVDGWLTFLPGGNAFPFLPPLP